MLYLILKGFLIKFNMKKSKTVVFIFIIRFSIRVYTLNYIHFNLSLILCFFFFI